MKFTTIYKSGKPEYFFIKADAPSEFAFLQPYFLTTTIDHPRKGRILKMDCLYSGAVWYGRQIHGYGYSASADVYGELIRIIKDLHKNRLTPEDNIFLDSINTHDESIEFPADFLDRLRGYNNDVIKAL